MISMNLLKFRGLLQSSSEPTMAVDLGKRRRPWWSSSSEKLCSISDLVVLKTRQGKKLYDNNYTLDQSRLLL